MNYRDWLQHELASAPAWHEHVDGRRAQALGPRRTASGYAIASYATVEEIRSTHDEWTALPRSDRAFAWLCRWREGAVTLERLYEAWPDGRA